jgi:hypothetical protein
LKDGFVFSSHLDSLASAWIAPRSPRGQSGGDLVEYRRNDQFSIHRPQMQVAGGEFRDEFYPGHRRLRIEGHRGASQSA